MKYFKYVFLWSFVLWTCASAILGTRRYDRDKKISPRGKCQVYSKDLCKPYLGGRSVFIKDGQTLENINNQMKSWLDTAHRSDSISPSCWPHAKALLCYHIFPLCGTNSKPMQTIFCRDECRHLEQRLCRQEFLLGRSISAVRQYIPYCGDLPGQGSLEFERCQRLPTLNVTRGTPLLTIEEQKNTHSKIGKRGALKCMFQVKGTSDIDIHNIDFQWHRNGKKIKKTKDKYKIKNRRRGLYGIVTTLVIKRVQLSDYGTYNCSVGFGKLKASSHSVLKLRQGSPSRKRPKENKGTIKKSSIEENIPGSATANKRITTRGSFGKCSFYRGLTCKKLLSHYNANIIFEYNHSPQYLVERKLQAELAALQGSKDISKRCHDFGLAVICFNMFQACNPNLGEPVPRLCKSDCKQFEEVICRKEVKAARIHQSLSELLPDCENLPEENPHCISLFAPISKVELTTTKTPTNFVTENETEWDCSMTADSSLYSSLSSSQAIVGIHCYQGYGENYRGQAQVSKSGRLCQKWDRYFPYSNVKHNYCRNFGGKMLAPWCFVGDGDKELCQIPKCSLVAQKTVSQDSTSLIIYVVPSAVVLALCLCATTVVALYVKHKKRKLEKETMEDKDENISLNIKIPNGDHYIRPMQPEPNNTGLLEIKVTQLKLLEKIRDGSFRQVWKAQLTAKTTPVNVIVKRARSDTPSSLLKDMQQEISLLRGFNHINVVGMVCVSAPGEPKFIAYECDNVMSLKCHVISRLRPEEHDKTISTERHIALIDLAIQVSQGVEYLHYNNFVHKDLGTRSCLVNSEGIVKVACFGFGQYSHPDDYVCDWKGGRAVAIRWMSPEALTRRFYSIYDDTWAFGVLLWELFTFGLKPFTEQDDTEVITQIKEGRLLPCPEQCPAGIFAFMKDCWDPTPEERPLFPEIRNMMSKWTGEIV